MTRITPKKGIKYTLNQKNEVFLTFPSYQSQISIHSFPVNSNSIHICIYFFLFLVHVDVKYFVNVATRLPIACTHFLKLHTLYERIFEICAITNDSFILAKLPSNFTSMDMLETEDDRLFQASWESLNTSIFQASNIELLFDVGLLLPKLSVERKCYFASHMPSSSYSVSQSPTFCS